MSFVQVPPITQPSSFIGRGTDELKSRWNDSELWRLYCEPAPLVSLGPPSSPLLNCAGGEAGAPDHSALGYYSDISYNWAWAGIFLFPAGIDFLSDFHFLLCIPLGSEQLCQTKAGLSPLEMFLDSLQLCVYINGQPGSAIKCLPSQILAVLPGWVPGVGTQ